jgi:Holliday junction resolvasome RuvABC endonuclease subunit
MIIAGIDMAFAHMGLALMQWQPHDLGSQLKLLKLTLISTAADDAGKVVRKSSTELRRARELREALHLFCQGADFACAEVPSGSMSASAARALGIAVGVLASCPVPVIEVSPKEVKMASVGSATASKDSIIAWATNRWPSDQWRSVRSKGGYRLTKDNEHLADACAAIVAGTMTDEFKRTVAYGRAYALSNLVVQRPAPDQQLEGRVSVEPHPVARRRLLNPPRA